MELKYKLLDHPFYKAWSCGEITTGQLSKYSASYLEFIESIPTYWERVIAGLNAEDSVAKEIVLEEKEHIYLWKKWSSKLGSVNSFPRMIEVLLEFEKMNPSELLGAIHAFEIQQPGVAKTKKEGLLNHYGFDESDSIYFDEHMNEQKHISFGEKLAKESADKKEFEKGFERGSELVYKSLDLFLN